MVTFIREGQEDQYEQICTYEENCKEGKIKQGKDVEIEYDCDLPNVGLYIVLIIIFVLLLVACTLGRRWRRKRYFQDKQLMHKPIMEDQMDEEVINELYK